MTYWDVAETWLVPMLAFGVQVLGLRFLFLMMRKSGGGQR